jgi:hypothetical protein
METTSVNPKTAWWRQHKNDPALKESMKASQRKYYQANREAVKQKALEYYYNVKRVKNQQVQEQAD